MKILSTKPLTDEECALASKEGATLSAIQVIDTQPVAFAWPLTAHYDAAVFTSSKGVERFITQPPHADWLKGIPVFALSGKTKAALIAKGIDVTATAATTSALAEVIIQHKDIHALLHPSSDKRLPFLEEKLMPYSISYHALTVYQTILLYPPATPPVYDAILFFSPSGVESFLKNNTIPASAVCGCIGNTTAAYVKKELPVATILTVDNPDSVLLLQTVISMLKQNKAFC